MESGSRDFLPCDRIRLQRWRPALSRPRPRDESAYLLTRFARCGVCGGTIGTDLRAHGSAGTAVCTNSVGLNQRLLDQAILAAISALLDEHVLGAAVDRACSRLTADVEKHRAQLMGVDARAGAVLVFPGGLIDPHARRIAELAARSRLPTMYVFRFYVEAGGLMSYGPDLIENNHRAAIFVDKILKGAKPADLPVEQPTKFELVINLKTAKALGLTITQSVLLRADQVIE